VLAVVLPCQADAVECDSSPMAAELCDCYATQEGLAVELADCRLMGQQTQAEREALDLQNTSLRATIRDLEADAARERERKRRWRAATPIAGGAGAVAGIVLALAVIL